MSPVGISSRGAPSRKLAKSVTLATSHPEIVLGSLTLVPRNMTAMFATCDVSQPLRGERSLTLVPSNMKAMFVTLGIPNADYSAMNASGQSAVDALCSDPPGWTIDVTSAPADCS
jgi:hypothetical protein